MLITALADGLKFEDIIVKNIHYSIINQNIPLRFERSYILCSCIFPFYLLAMIFLTWMNVWYLRWRALWSFRSYCLSSLSVKKLNNLPGSHLMQFTFQWNCWIQRFLVCTLSWNNNFWNTLYISLWLLVSVDCCSRFRVYSTHIFFIH